MRSMEMSAKTVEAAVQAACEALGVDRDDINVSYEVLEFPTRKLFKTSSWAWMSAVTATSARTTSLPLPGALQTASSARAATMRWSQ